jgi:hypothetical protein
MAPRGLTKMPRDPKFYSFSRKIYRVIFCKAVFSLVYWILRKVFKSNKTDKSLIFSYASCTFSGCKIICCIKNTCVVIEAYHTTMNFYNYILEVIYWNCSYSKCSHSWSTFPHRYYPVDSFPFSATATALLRESTCLNWMHAREPLNFTGEHFRGS